MLSKVEEAHRRRLEMAQLHVLASERVRAAVENTFRRQKRALVNESEWNMTRWNRELADDLFGALCQVAKDDVIAAGAALRRYADGVAESVNDRTITRGFPDAEQVAGEVAAWVVKHHPLRRLQEGTEYDEGITRRGVMLRDEWTCAICKEPIEDVPWESGGDNSRYGTVDHVIAIEDGGDHTWDNVQAVHYGCNSGRWYESRRNSPQGE
jgi:hypothetical protein